MTDHQKDARIAALEAMLARGMAVALRAYFNANHQVWTYYEAGLFHADAEDLLGEHRPEGRTEHAE